MSGVPDSIPESDPVATQLPRVCAVVPAFNRREKTLRFLESMRKVAYPNLRVIVTDDNSSDGTRDAIRERFPEVTVLKGTGDLWWSGGTNMAIREALAADVEYILTINDDSVMDPQFLMRLVEMAGRHPRSIVAARVMREDHPERVWALGASCVFRGRQIYALNLHDRVWSEIESSVADPYPVDTMPGNGVLIPAQVFREVGFYDEKNLPQYHADSDFVLRARKRGFRALIAAKAVIFNHMSTVPLTSGRKQLVFSKKSDFYYRAIATTIFRHAPIVHAVPVFVASYAQFFVPSFVRTTVRRLRLRAPAPRTTG